MRHCWSHSECGNSVGLMANTTIQSKTRLRDISGRHVVNWTTGFQAIFNSKQNLEEVINIMLISYVGVWRTWSWLNRRQGRWWGTTQLLSVLVSYLPIQEGRFLQIWNLHWVSGAAPCFHLYQCVTMVLFFFFLHFDTSLSILKH